MRNLFLRSKFEIQKTRKRFISMGCSFLDSVSSKWNIICLHLYVIFQAIWIKERKYRSLIHIIHHSEHRSFPKTHMLVHWTWRMVKIHLVCWAIALIRFQKWIFVYCLLHIHNFVCKTKNECSLSFIRAHLEPFLYKSICSNNTNL